MFESRSKSPSRGRRPLCSTLDLRDPVQSTGDRSVWGEDWVHDRQYLLLVPRARDLDVDEIVFFVPGAALHMSDDARAARPATIGEAIGWSMLWRANAAYVAPRFACFHEQFSIAAWFGILASGRSAWLPEGFAQRIMDAGFAEVQEVADQIFERSVRRWRLGYHIKSSARRVSERKVPRVVVGAKLRSSAEHSGLEG